MIRAHKALLIITTFLFTIFSPYQGILFAASPQAPTPFTDLPSDQMYYPAIQTFQNQNIIIGDTMGGKPIAKLRPTDHLQRDEFTKVAAIVRLLEQGNTHLLNEELNPFTLKLNTLLQPYYKATAANGAVAFKDIEEKDEHCAMDPGGCSPWHTEYINYASSQGMIKGYAENNTFRPTNSILRIHGLKLAIAGNGDLPASQDSRFLRLSNDSRIQNRAPRCLAGTESYILANNGGNTKDSQNLLAYALLADKLDIFGNRCQTFTSAGISLNNKQAIADYLQKPLTRQEIARYFALTTTIAQLQLDPGTDATVDTKAEYIMPISTEIKEEESSVLDGIRSANNSTFTQPRTAPEPDEPIEVINKPSADLTVAEKATITKQGRCCSGMNTSAECKIIQYSNYFIEERSELGEFVDGTSLWNKAQRGSETCYIPFADIVNGYEEEARITLNSSVGTTLVASNSDSNFISSERAMPLLPSNVSIDRGGIKLRDNNYTVYPNKSPIWICTDIRDNKYAKSPDACKTTVNSGESLKTIGGVIVGRYSKNGKTRLWQKVSYNGKTYYALVRDLDYRYADSDVDRYIGLRLNAEAEGSSAETRGNIASYDEVPDSPNWAEPINVLTGNFWSEKTDLQVPTRGPAAAITRTYNADNLIEGSMGTGWSFAYGITLVLNEFGQIKLTFGDGHQITFSEDEKGIYRADNRDGELQRKNEGFRYRQKNGQSYEFTNDGKLLSIKSRFGNGLHFDRTADDLVTAVRDDMETLFTLEYDEEGYITKVTDLSGRVVKYSYKNDDLVKVCGPKFWSCYKYSYDDQHRLLTIRNEKGRMMIENEYDKEDRVIRQTDVMGAVVSLDYHDGKTVMTDALGRSKTHYYNGAYMTTLEEDELGNKKEFIYDDFGLLIKLIDPNGNETSYEYDSFGNKISQTDALGNITTYAYNLSDRLTSVTDSRGNETKMEYDKDNNLSKLTDALGNSTLYGYDEFSQKTREENAVGAVTEWAYNEDGTLHSVIDSLGNATLYTYDEARHLAKVTDALGSETEFEYDKNDHLIEIEQSEVKTGKNKYNRLGNRVYEKDANKNKTKYYYDNKNRLLKEKNAEGEKTDYIYDDNDNLLKSFSADAETKYDYDAAGRLTSVTNALGFALSYEYDQNGNKTKVTDPEGGATVLVYDKLNRLIKTIDAEGGVIEFIHDKNGNLIRAINAEGGIKTAEFDMLNRLTKTTDKMGYETHYEYDAVGNQTKITDPNGGDLTFEYDLNGNLTAETDAEGSKATYHYDELNRQAQVTDPLGGKTGTAYDKLGRVIGQKDDMGSVTTFIYDLAGNRIESTDANGNSARFVYDDLNRLTKSIDLAGNMTKSTYDRAGNLTEVKDARGTVYRYEYDKLGRMTKSIAPSGLISEFIYDKNDRQTKITADGKTTTFEYDKLGRLTAQANALGHTSKYEYDKLGRRIKTTDPEGNETKYSYNNLGQNTSITNALGNTKTSTYDALGNVLSKTDFNGNLATYEYDKNGRLIALSDSAGHTIRYKYDAAGNQINVKDPNGNSVQSVYNSLGRLVKTSNHNGAGTVFTYDAVGNKIMQERFAEDETAQRMLYTYDSLGRLTSAIDSMGEAVHYKYDENSNRTRIIDQNGHRTRTAFDKMNRPIKTTDPLGNSEAWVYDQMGNITTHTDKNDLTETRTYDALSRLIKKQKGDLTITQEYDNLGNMTTIEGQNGKITVTYNQVGFTTSVTDQNENATYYKYDPAGHLIKRSDLAGSTQYHYNNNVVTQIAFTPKDARSRRPMTYNFAYNPLGQIAKLTYPDKTATDYTYDDLGRLMTIRTGNKLVTDYAYNAFDMKTKAVTMSAEEITEESFIYDPVGRLSQWTSNNQTESYTYDPAYNRTSVTNENGTVKYRYNAMNQLISDGNSKYRYDKNGFLTSGSTASYNWDAYGRLASYSDDSAKVEYDYDSLNRMTERRSNELVTNFTYAGLANQFVLESVQEKEAEMLHETTYLYDMNGSPLARYNAGRPYAFLKNAHNDVVASLSEGGDLTDEITYTVFGESDTDQTLAFQGQYSDSDTGLSHLNARLYNPDTAQFLSPDSFPGKTEVPYSLNKYAYSHNDPVNYWDQSGMYNSVIHYKKTKDWAYAAATDTGFSYEMSRQLALNIASFDQYHDKEWTLAPNNYALGSGQGNNLHFMNSDRDQMSFGQAQPQYNAPGTSPTIGLRNTFSNNEFVDPLSTKVVGETTIPIYKMKSLNEFNSSAGADELSNNPRAVRDGEALGFISLSGGTIKQRLQYAVDNHDPRLFGVVMHEYQDSFAHAGFEKWHGTSHDNDLYCETTNTSEKCTGIERIQSGNTTYFNNDGIQTAKALLERDKLMKEGVQYWMKKFMQKQAEHYGAQLSRTIMYNKEEKVVHDANKVLKVEEEFGGYPMLDKKRLLYNDRWIDYGVYGNQGKEKGGFPNNFCILLSLQGNECSVFASDLSRQIKR